jgi:hypothetical protein
VLAAGVLVVLAGWTAATHNSVGAPHVHLIEPDEVDRDTGELAPDVPHPDHPDVDDEREPSPYHASYHERLAKDGLDPRPAPVDQSGDRYTRCTTAEQAGDAYDPANRSDHCYVGYVDHILEHTIPTGPLLVTECPCDLLYPVNPAEDDEYCRGEKETNEVTGNEDVDTAITNLQRTQDSDCGTRQHNQYLTGSLLIDTSLLEAPNAAAADQLGNDVGSGPLTLDGLATSYVLLLGQPHPSNEDPSPYEAGEGPFGGDPLAGGNPLHDLEGACGDRTEECRLLEPADVEAYDRFDPGWRDGPRVCAFLPQHDVSPEDPTGTEWRCGLKGNPLDEFVDTGKAGGLGVEGAPPTWVTNLPGWSISYVYTSYPADNTLQPARQAVEPDPDERAGLEVTVAVNPEVPTPGSDLGCLTPNLLAHGDDAPLPGDHEDPGVYGHYAADAIDVDVHPHPYRDQLDTAGQAAREALTPARTLAQDVAEGPRGADDAARSAAGLLPAPVERPAAETVDRANPLAERTSPEHAQPGGANPRAFTAHADAGLACDTAGQLVYHPEDATLDGGLAFEADLEQATVALEDPTALDEGQPARSTDTNGGAWRADAYRLEGRTVGVVDANENGAFDACGPIEGYRGDPGNDACPWRAIWDAYADWCTRDGFACEDELARYGYNVRGETGPDDQAGVGLTFRVEVTGPVLVTAAPDPGNVPLDTPGTPRAHVIGAGDPTATNCLVGVSEGFEAHLPNHVDGADGPDELAAELCGDVDGERVLLADAFRPQGADLGDFETRLAWTPLTPTPDGLEPATGFGEGDEVCVTGYFSVGAQTSRDEPIDVARDTEGNLNLEANTVHVFQHGQSLETGTDAPEPTATC